MDTRCWVCQSASVSPTDAKEGGLGSTSTRQNPHLPAFLSYKGLTQASIGFRFILFPVLSVLALKKKNITERKQPERAGGAGLQAGGQAD